MLPRLGVFKSTNSTAQGDWRKSVRAKVTGN